MSRNKKLAIFLIILIIAILGAIAFATGKDDSTKSNDTKKSAKVEKKTEAKSDEDSNKGEVEGATIVTEGNPQYTAPAPAVAKTASAKTTAVPTSTATTTTSTQTTQTPATTPTAPETPTTPQTPTDPEEPVSCFVRGEGTIYVPRGGNSESYTISFDSPVLLMAYDAEAEYISKSDDEANVKPGFPVFIVIENEDFNWNTPTTSVTFHLHSRSTAPLGDYCPDTTFTNPGFSVRDPETYMPIDGGIFDITIVDPQAV